MKNSKGMSLVMAIMIVTIMMILSAGVFFVVGSTNSMVANKEEDMRLFYAAEGGLNHGLRQLKSLSVAAFQAGTGFATQTLTIGGRTVVVACQNTATSGVAHYTITATAGDANGRRVVNTLSDVFNEGINALTVGNGGPMDQSLAFAGDNTSAASLGDYNISKDINIGDMYFAGVFNIEGKPLFKGNIISSASDLSKRVDGYNPNETKEWVSTGWFSGYWKITPAGFGTESNDLSSLMRTMYDGKYNKGIIDRTSTSNGETVDNPLTSSVDESLPMKTRFADVFGTGYTGGQSARPLTNGVDSLAAMKAKSTAVTLTGSGTAEISISGNTATITGLGATQTVNLAQKNIIILPDDVTQANLNESVIGSCVTIVSKKANFDIKGNICYSELTTGVDYRTKNKAWGADEDNITELQDKIQNDVTSAFSVIAYGDGGGGNVRIHNSVGDTSDEITNKILLLTGTFYCPNGKFGANDETNAKAFAGSKRVVNIGSVLMHSKGLYRSGGIGITATLANDKRNSEDGLISPGFVPMTENNAFEGRRYVLVSNSGQTWSSQSFK